MNRRHALAILLAGALPRQVLAQGCTGAFGAPIVCPTTSGGLETGYFPPRNLELRIAEGDVEGEVDGRIVPIPVPKPNPRLEELIALKPAYRNPPYPRRKPRLPQAMELRRSDYLNAMELEWSTAFVESFTNRFHEHYDTDPENLAVKGFVRAFIHKYKMAGWEGNIGIEAAVTEGLDIIRGNKEIDDWAVNLVGLCLMLSQAFLVEAVMKFPPVFVVTKLPFFGDAAERVARSSAEIAVIGFTEAIVTATIAMYAVSDAIEQRREYREWEDKILEARKKGNFSLNGGSYKDCSETNIASGLKLTTCFGP